MLDYAQSFEEFSRSVKPIDLALYAGVGLVLWVLFKDKLSPVQNLVLSLVDKVKSLVGGSKKVVETNVVPPVSKKGFLGFGASDDKQDVFFQLVASWKQTRDLAVKSGCEQAVKVADQMFPYLSPTVCKGENNE